MEVHWIMPWFALILAKVAWFIKLSLLHSDTVANKFSNKLDCESISWENKVWAPSYLLLQNGMFNLINGTFGWNQWMELFEGDSLSLRLTAIWCDLKMNQILSLCNDRQLSGIRAPSRKIIWCLWSADCMVTGQEIWSRVLDCWGFQCWRFTAIAI